MKRSLLTLIFVCLSIESALSQVNGSINHGGQNRTYTLYVPASYTNTQAVPLVLILHGTTQTGSGIMNFSGFNNIADTAGFIAVYPDGIGNAWNFQSTLIGSSTADDFGFLEALIDTLSAQYNISQDKIYSCGFSAGGFMSHLLACQSSRCFAAIASVSGTMSDSTFTTCSPAYHIPVLQIHGTSDAVVSFNGSLGNQSVNAVMDYWKSFNNCNSTPVITALPNTSLLDFSTVDLYNYAPCQNGFDVRLLKVNGGGHQWPGTTNLLAGLGSINMDIDASAQIWNFMQPHACISNVQVINEGALPIFSCKTGYEGYTISGPAGDFTLRLVSVDGRIVSRRTVSLPYSFQIDASLTGVYIVKLSSEKAVWSTRIVAR